MLKLDVCRSRLAIPKVVIAASTLVMAAELAVSASRAVKASRMTLKCSTAISGAISTLPAPVTRIRGAGSSPATANCPPTTKHAVIASRAAPLNITLFFTLFSHSLSIANVMPTGTSVTLLCVAQATKNAVIKTPAMLETTKLRDKTR